MFRNPQETHFKNSTGQFLIKALFWETNDSQPEQVLFTLKDEDYRGYPSLRRLYLLENDETEYIFAKKYFFSYEHWKKISESSWFLPFVTRWREELYLQVLTTALSKIREVAEGTSRDAFAAQKYLLEKPYLRVKTTKRVGRPDKEILPEDNTILNKTLNEDLQRMGLN